MAKTLDAVSTKIVIEVNSTPAGSTEPSTANVTIGGLNTAITAANVGALVDAVSPLLEFPVIETRKTDVSVLSDDEE